MMTYTLVAEGPSDECLCRITDWILQVHLGVRQFQRQWADCIRMRSRLAKRGLVEELRSAADLYPCDLMIVHRDAEKLSSADRCEQISASVQAAFADGARPRYVCLVPVRMTEAWLLSDEQAIRHAAGNPNGTVKLDLPRPSQVEYLPDPKAVLKTALRTASQLQGRRLKKLDTARLQCRVADLTADFTPLLQVSAFCRFSQDLQRVVDELI